jgi:hypothetical protein
MQRAGLVLVGLGAAWTSPCAAQDSAEATAQKIVAQAREAAGGAAKLKSVQSLSVSGKSRWQVRMSFGGPGGPGGQAPPASLMEGEFELDVLAPDKYVRRDTREVMGGQATIIIHSGFNGDRPIQRTETIGDLPMNPNMPFGAGDPAMRLRRARQEFLRNWMGWLFEPPPAYGITLRGAGSESMGGANYDVIEAAGSDNLSARLYFDTTTHRLALLRYKGASMPQMVRMVGPPPGQGVNPPPPPEGQPQTALQRPSSPAAEVEVEVSFSDFKAADGILLPHRIQRRVNGEVLEETEIKKYKVNSNPKADRFKTTE